MPFLLSQVFYDICVIPALQRLASSNNDVAAKQAILALRTIGEEIPAKLSFNISCWTIKEVQMWVGINVLLFASHVAFCRVDKG